MTARLLSLNGFVTLLLPLSRLLRFELRHKHNLTIDEPRKSSKAIDERIIINFCDNNVIIARFRSRNGGLYPIYIYMYIYFIYFYIYILFY